jgi:hypothetical protein
MSVQPKVASIDIKRMSPLDLTIYRKNREVLTRVISLQKLWKDAITPLEKKETKRLTLKLINENFESVEKTCGFLGAISTPYILTRIRKQIEETLSSMLEKYDIPFTERKKKVFYEIYETQYLYDDLDIWLNIKEKN